MIYVTIVIHDVFCRRMIASEHSWVNKRTKDNIINIILKQVPIPKRFEPDEREEMLNKVKR